jgi:hypothetical protein
MMEELKGEAIELLKEDFDPELEYDLKTEQILETHPLRDPGLSVIFSFQPDPSVDDRYFVITGNVLPMIYPDYGLSIEEIWAMHIGMEYFIKMGVAEDTEKNFPQLLSYVKMVSTVFQEQLYITLTGPPKVEKVYVLGDQKHVVGKATYEGKVYSWIVGDIPHFVYKKDLPPQIIWSFHMGRILLT